MSTTRANFRKLLSQAIGDWKTDTTSSAGTTAGIICVRLADRSDSFYNEQFVRLTSGTGTWLNDTRRIQTFTQAGGVIAAYAAFTSAPSPTGLTFEIHRIDPDEKDQAIKEACRETYPHLRKEIVDKTLVGGNPLPNSHFEDWVSSATKPDNWNISGASFTVAASTAAETFRGGATSVALTRAGTNGYLYISESEWPALLDFNNSVIGIYCWAKSSVASQMRISVYTKTAAGVETTTNGSYHTGGGEWERLENLSLSIPDNLVDIEIRISDDGSNTVCYADNCRVIGFPHYKYLLPAQFVTFPNKIYYQADSGQSRFGCDDVDEQLPWVELFGWKPLDDGTNKYITFKYAVPGQRKLILKGDGYLSQPTTDSSTIEVNDPEAKALVEYAAYLLYDRLSAAPSREDIGRTEREALKWKSKWEQDKPPAIISVAMRA